MYGYPIPAPLVVTLSHEPPDAQPQPPDVVRSSSAMYCATLVGSYGVATIPTKQ